MKWILLAAAITPVLGSVCAGVSAEEVDSAADKLQVGRMLLKPQDDSTEIEPMSWQRDAYSDEPRKAIHVSFPYSDGMTGHKSLIEIEVEVDKYLELASHRAKLFGHLIDEYSNGYHPAGQKKVATSYQT